MTRISRCQLLGVVFGAFAAFALAPAVWAAGPICFRCKTQPVNMPVSLAVGTVRTPEFLVKDTDYTIKIRVKRGLPLGQLECMMGVREMGGHDHCAMYHWDTVLEVEWTVWDGENVVAQGTTHDKDSDLGGVSDDTLDRNLGTFDGEANKKYVVEVRFTKDGTPLSEFKPRLIVQHTVYYGVSTSQP